MEENIHIKQVIVNEKSLSLREANKLITEIYNQQINYYKTNFLKIWEQNHELSPKAKEEKIAALKKAKNELYRKIRSQLAESDKVVINTKLEMGLEIKPIT